MKNNNTKNAFAVMDEQAYRQESLRLLENNQKETKRLRMALILGFLAVMCKFYGEDIARGFEGPAKQIIRHYSN
jgi:hypothetical protein